MEGRIDVDALQRLIEFEACFNFRDLGGYETTDGRRLRWRRLYRADTLHRLSDADLERFRELRLRTVVDLRSAMEIDDFGALRDDADPAVEVHHVPMMDVVSLRVGRPGVANAPQQVEWAEAYLRILGDGTGLARAVTLLAERDRLPAVFHCTAGKDRTGILAAVLLDLLGVPESTILEDYALTEVTRQRSRAWIEANEPELAAFFAQVPRDATRTGPAALVNLFATIRTTHGGTAAYLEDLGVPAEAIDVLRSSLLEP